MKTITRAILLGVALASPVTHAALSTNDAAAACKDEARIRYGQNDASVRVKFKGMYGGATNRKVRLQVLPSEGKAFLAICDLNGMTGEVLALSPPSAPARALAAAGR